MHLCMKNLNFRKDYCLEDVKDLIQDLRVRGIITKKESENIYPNAILEFTKSHIFDEEMDIYYMRL